MPRPHAFSSLPTRRGTIGFLAVSALLAATTVVGIAATSPPAFAATGPTTIVCNNDGIVVRSDNGDPSTLQRARINTNGTVTYSTVGQLNEVINAIGYNLQDGLIYGTANATKHFVKFGENAGAGEVDLGIPTNTATGAPLTGYQAPLSGAVTEDGVHLAFVNPTGANNTYALLKTNLKTSPLTSTVVPLSFGAGVTSADFTPTDVSFNPYNNLLYAMVAGQVYSVDASMNPAPVNLVATNPAVASPAVSAGGSWTDSLGNIYFFQNNGMVGQAVSIYKLDPTTNDLTAVAPATKIGQFDATACLPPTMSKTVSAQSVGIGETLTFTFTLANPGASTAIGHNFTDTLPNGSGLQWVAGSVTPASPGGGTVTLTPSTFSIDRVTIPNARTGPLQFSAQARLVNPPSGGGGIYVNQSTITYNSTPIMSDDPDDPGSTDGTTFTVRNPPTTTNDSATTPQDVTVSVPVLTNDQGNSNAIDPASLRLVGANGALVTTLTVPNQGTYTVDTTTHEVVFDPLPTFAGPATPVTYSVADTAGDRVTATLGISVTAAPAPTPTADSDTGGYNQPVVVKPLGNDNPGATNASFDLSSLRLIDPASGNPATTVTIADQGAYAVDTSTGEVTFTPLSSFTGPATPLTYQAATTFGKQVTSTISLTTTAPGPPTAVNDRETTPHAKAVVVTPLSNDTSGPAGTSFDPFSLRLIDPATGNPATTVTVTGEGRWVVNTTTSDVTFTPDTAQNGPTTAIGYTVTTNTGATLTGADLQVTVLPPPTATADPVTTAYGTATNVDPLTNDTRGNPNAALQPATVRLLDTNNNPVTTLPVAGGTFTVRSDGTVDFVPDAGFSGTATVPYQVADTDGNMATSGISVTVGTPPTGVADDQPGHQNQAVAFTPTQNDTRGDRNRPIDPTTTRLIDPVSGNPVTSVTVADEGTWSVDTTTGNVTFTPLPTFTDRTTAITYTAADDEHVPYRSTMTATIAAAAAPSAAPDPQTGAYNQPVVVTPLANDDPGPAGASFVPSSLVLVDPATNTAVSTVTVVNQGTYVLDPTTGEVTFTPLASFTGPATPITYRASTTFGRQVSSTIDITTGAPGAPSAVDDRVTAAHGHDITLVPLSNDTSGPAGTSFVAASFALIDSATGNPVTTLTVANEGTWVVDPSNAHVTFTPDPGQTGPTTAIGYTVRTNTGTTLTGANLQVNVLPPPIGVADDVSTPFGQPTHLMPTSNDTSGNPSKPLQPATLQLLDPNGNTVTSLPGSSGTFSVRNDGTGTVDFVPTAGFSGTASAAYQVVDGDGNTAKATVTVKVGTPPTGRPDDEGGRPAQPVSFLPTQNDTPGNLGTPIDPTTVRLVDPVSGNAVTTVSVAQQGDWTIDTTTGAVTFTPLPTFTGQAAAITYTAADRSGVPYRSTMTVTLTTVDPGNPPPPPAATTDNPATVQGMPVTFDPLTNDTANGSTFVPSSVRFTVTGQPRNATVANNGKTLTVPGQGVYTVASTGLITFTPEPSFSGTATPVSYSVTDTAGMVATATIAAMVTAAVATPPASSPPGPSSGSSTSPGSPIIGSIPAPNSAGSTTSPEGGVLGADATPNSGSSGALASTGVRVGLMSVTALVLLAAGLLLTLGARRRRGH